MRPSWLISLTVLMSLAPAAAVTAGSPPDAAAVTAASPPDAAAVTAGSPPDAAAVTAGSPPDAAAAPAPKTAPPGTATAPDQKIGPMGGLIGAPRSASQAPNAAPGGGAPATAQTASPGSPAPAAKPAKPEPAKENPAEAGKAGIKLFQREGPIYVHEIVEGSPAANAAILPGDQLIAVNGEPVEDLAIAEVTKRIRGPIDSRVTLTVRTPGKPPREVAITRAALPEVPKKPVIATSALPRLKAFASRAEIPSLLKAIEDVERDNRPEELREAYPIAVAALAKANAPEARTKAFALFPKALELAPRSLDLPTAAEALYLDGASPAPPEARRLSRTALDGLAKIKTPDRPTRRAIAAWTAVQGRAELAAGDQVKGLKLLEDSLKLQPGERLAAVGIDGKLRWSAATGPKDRWEKVARAQLEAKRPGDAAGLALEALRWGEDPAARKVLEDAVKAGAKVDLKPWADDAWPIVPDSVPGLVLTDVQGVDHSLEDLRGKVVLISLWATWCGPCHRELEALKETYARFKDRGFEILAVSVDTDTELVAPFVEKKALPYPAGLAPKRAALYRSTNVPVSFLVDREGRLAWSHVGFGEESLHELEAQIDGLLAGKSNATRALVDNGWQLNRLELTAHGDVPRVVDVEVALGPQGPQIWALRANGTLDVLRLARPSEEDPTPGNQLETLQSLNGFGGFNRLGKVDLEGDRISERILAKTGQGTVVVENIINGRTRLFLVAESGIGDTEGVDLNGDGRQELLVGYWGKGLRAVDPEGAPLWWHPEGEMRAFAVSDIDQDKKPEVVLPGKEGQLQVFSHDGQLRKSIDATGPAERLMLARLEPKGAPVVIARDKGLVEAVAADLDGDGRDEIALATGGGTVVVLKSDGTLLSRISFNGERLSLASGDLNLDGREELVVGGEGLGVAVINLRPPLTDAGSSDGPTRLGFFPGSRTTGML